MPRRMALLAFVVLQAATASAASADGPSNPWELTLGSSAGANNDFTAGGLGADVGLGRFLSEHFELSLRQSILYTSFPNGTNWLSTTRLAMDYQFGREGLCPFVGAQAGYAIGIHNTSSFEAGPRIGMKYYLSRSTFIYSGVEYDWMLRHRSLNGGIRNSEWLLTVGLGFSW